MRRWRWRYAWSRFIFIRVIGDVEVGSLSSGGVAKMVSWNTKVLSKAVGKEFLLSSGHLEVGDGAVLDRGLIFGARHLGDIIILIERDIFRTEC